MRIWPVCIGTKMDDLANGPLTSSRDWVESRLRRIVRLRPGSPVDERELQHLVHVILHSSVLMQKVYTDENLRTIVEGDFESTLEAPVLALLHGRTDEESLHRLRRLPDEVRAVGDQALFDVGVSRLTRVRGYPLHELGVRAYRLASEILNRLADDRRLREYFDSNRLKPLPLEEEVTFLRQCAKRFDLHAQLLRGLSQVDPGEYPEDSGLLSLGGIGARVPEQTTDIAIGGATLAEVSGTPRPSNETPLNSPVPRETDFGWQERSREEIIARYERLLLFSALEVEALRSELTAAVIGQEGAVETLCDEFSLYAAGTQDPARPSSYFFVGPTGVGKNHLVETLTLILSRQWGVEIPYLQIEGPNYTDASDINELRGSTRGFIRSDESGLLAEFNERALKAPFSVILIDEVEKAHPHLRKFFLSMMDRGTLTDNRGKTLRFAGSMLVFTSNLGYSEYAAQSAPIGYHDSESKDTAERSDAERGLKRALSPEFLNRLKLVRFEHLSRPSIERIFDLEFGRIVERFRAAHAIDLDVSPEAREHLLALGYSKEFGARRLSAILERHCNVEVARKIRREELPRKPGNGETLAWLREMRAGDRAFDEAEVRQRVFQEARARLPYTRLRLELVDGGIAIQGVS